MSIKLTAEDKETIISKRDQWQIRKAFLKQDGAKPIEAEIAIEFIIQTINAILGEPTEMIYYCTRCHLLHFGAVCLQCEGDNVVSKTVSISEANRIVAERLNGANRSAV